MTSQVMKRVVPIHRGGIKGYFRTQLRLALSGTSANVKQLGDLIRHRDSAVWPETEDGLPLICSTTQRSGGANCAHEIYFNHFC
jgi:hypothetical protein